MSKKKKHSKKKQYQKKKSQQKPVTQSVQQSAKKKQEPKKRQTGVKPEVKKPAETIKPAVPAQTPVRKPEPKKPKEEKIVPEKKKFFGKGWWKDTILTDILKYGFSIVLAYLAYQTAGDIKYFWMCLLELGAIAFLSDSLVRKNRYIGQIVNDILIILFNIQCGFLYYSGTYVTTVMLENTDSIEALSGRAGAYGVLIALVAVFTLLPVHPFRLKHISPSGLLSLFLCGELIVTMAFGPGFSPLYSAADLYSSVKKNQEMMEELAAETTDEENVTLDFYREGLENFYSKPAVLEEKPNVLLIFTEGLSQNVIDDKRDIMPNVKKYQKESLNFKNYFNHTFATYRAISGQLYSGYQLGNYDKNTLVSIQDVMKEQGYHTSFINSEPNNMHFTSYLTDMGFDEIISSPNGSRKQYLEDTETYDLVFDTMQKQAETGEPFFTAVYTFATHVSINPPSNHFGDGTDHCLNKFHNLDVCFGEFMEKLENSELANNTVVIFTTDHASYSDAEYLNAFPAKVNPEMDRIPLFIWYNGVEPDEFDAEGRNSICMVPTVLDFLDINAVNYFLGFTMFAPLEATNNNFDTTFFDGTSYYTSDHSKVAKMADGPKELIEQFLKKYFTAKQQTPKKPE